ncbi:hypothetical protein pb186bvf_016229 [Paramecium bursaria]
MNGDCMNQFCQNENVPLFQAVFSDQTLNFCQKCHDLYISHKCCYFCAQIYSDENNTNLDGKEWVECDIDNCGKWTHVECEKRNGEQNIENLLKNSKYTYQCPWCRIENQRQKKIITTKKIHKHSPDTRQQEPPKPFIDELLKKYGGFILQVTLEEKLMDLEKIKSLLNQQL